MENRRTESLSKSIPNDPNKRPKFPPAPTASLLSETTEQNLDQLWNEDSFQISEQVSITITPIPESPNNDVAALEIETKHLAMDSLLEMKAEQKYTEIIVPETNEITTSTSNVSEIKVVDSRKPLDVICEDYKKERNGKEIKQLSHMLSYCEQHNYGWKYKEIKQWFMLRHRKNSKLAAITSQTQPKAQNKAHDTSKTSKTPKRKTKKSKNTKQQITKENMEVHREVSDSKHAENDHEEKQTNVELEAIDTNTAPQPQTLHKSVSDPLQSSSKIKKPMTTFKRYISLSPKRWFNDIPEHSPITPSPHIPTLDDKQDVNDIMKILNEYQLLINEKQIRQIIKEYNYDRTELIDDLIKAYRATNDEDIKLSQLLSAENYADRQKFYDVILKQFVSKDELTSSQFIEMLIKTIKDLKFNIIEDIDLNECRQLAANASLKGTVLSDKTSGEFAKVFVSMNIDETVWQKVYRKMKEWKAREYTQLDFEAIKDYLTANFFMDKDEIEILQSALKTAPNSDEKEEKYVQVTGYNEDRLMDELCDGFVDEEDANIPIAHILRQELEFIDAPKRKQFYDVLLHKYFKLHQLNTINFVKILGVCMKQIDEKWKPDEKAVKQIAIEHKVNGKMYVKGQKESKNAIVFGKLFKNVQYYNRKHFAALYRKIKEWKVSKEYPVKHHHVDRKWKVKLIRNTHKENEFDPLPKYIHKCIWYQSWDEKIETLIDQAVLKLLHLQCWNNSNFVQKIYDSAITTYYEAIQTVYLETGKTEFFETFIKENYKREIELWKIKCENTVLITDREKIYEKIHDIDFKEFDFDGDGQLNKAELQKCFRANGLRMEPYLLDEIFDQMDKDNDGDVDIAEFAKFREQQNFSHSGECQYCYFEWDEKDDEYQIFGSKLNTRHAVPVLNDNRYKWMCYIPQIPVQNKENFRRFHPEAVVNGYWEHMNTDIQHANAIRQRHLDQIFAVLNYYYRNQRNKDCKWSKSSLADLRKTKRKITIRFLIANENDTDEDYIYELCWWNQKGRFETNAIAIRIGKKEDLPLLEMENIQRTLTVATTLHKLKSVATFVNDSEPEPKIIFTDEIICYLRFKNLIKITDAESGLKWEWYDNNAAEAKQMGVVSGKKRTEIYQPLIEQLEASYLGNILDNFDAKRLKPLEFNNCWLPELSKFLREIVGLKKSADDYVFTATFREGGRNVIENMNQVGYTQCDGAEKAFFERNISRFINGQNSLEATWTVADTMAFVRRWQRMYRLFTEQQQKYFWCFILSIATQIKYIDIEFENQLILLPFAEDIESKRGKSQNIINALIDYHDVKMEQEDASYFGGSLIPPFDVWQHVEKDKKRNVQLSKTGILRKAKLKGSDGKKANKDKWMMHEDEPLSAFMFTKDDAILLRMIDCIRKFVLEYELGHAALWPWHQNSKFFELSKNKYNDLMQKYNLVKGYNIRQKYDTNEVDLEASNEHKESNCCTYCLCCRCCAKKDINPPKLKENESASSTIAVEDKNASIRHKRKWASLVLLNHELERNLNYIRIYLERTLAPLVDKACDDLKDNDDAIDMKLKHKIEVMQHQLDAMMDHLHIETEMEIDEQKIAAIERFIKQNVKPNKQIWIEKSHVLDGIKPNLQNTTLDIDAYQWLFFNQFMYCCFIEPDKNMYKTNKDRKKDSGQAFFYRVFMDFWRDVPDFWTYSHDVLLLELVLRNGIDCEAILQDLDESESKYKHRKHNIAREIPEDSGSANVDNVVTNHPFYAFKTWCKSQINILHRLKYITSTIVIQLNSNPNIESRQQFTIFSDYQMQSHLQFIERKEWKYSETRIEDNPKNEGRFRAKSMDLGRKIDNRSGAMSAIHKDPYIARNIERELFESLQAFDLMKYGAVITRFMMNKLKHEAKESHYVVLGHLFYSLPDPIAVEMLKESKAILQRAKPRQLKDLCLQIEAGSIFKTSADLNIAEFLGNLAKTDLSQAETWTQYSQEFERMAFENIAEMEDDHMMFVLLTIPLPFHHGKCLIQLAQEQERASFLNQQRIAAVVEHIYASGYLKPQDRIQTSGVTWRGMFHTAFYHPFLFYLTAQGYHWVEGILYAQYLILLFLYAFFWPLSPDMESDTELGTIWLKTLQICFWCSNLGFILYEVEEYFEKGKNEYFNFAVMGQTNVMDVGVSIIWLILFGLRVVIFVTTDDDHEVHENRILDLLQHGFVFLFGIQILLITFRSFKIVNSSEYFGTMLRIIKLMLQEFIKFALIFFMIMVAALFGIWFISGVHQDIEELFWQKGFRFGLLYMFEIFVGTKEISDWEMDYIPSLYLVITAMLGTLLLLNLLIATMASKYDEVKERAHQEVILRKTELSFDLLRRSRHMPPPLNIVLYIVTFLVWFFNFFISCLRPKWNVFGTTHFDAFENMKMFNFWKCRYRKCSYVDVYNEGNQINVSLNVNQKREKKLEVKALKYFGSMNQYEILKWYCGCRKIEKVHHTGCYGNMKLFSEQIKEINVDGITMSKYFETYEESKKRLISRQDKIVLNKLTANTLFCPHCYHGFSNTEQMQEKEFVSPFTPLFDYISAILFVVIPIVWIPILIMFGLCVIYDRIFGRFKLANKNNEDYSNKDYDRNYFPQFIPSKVMYVQK